MALAREIEPPTKAPSIAIATVCKLPGTLVAHPLARAKPPASIGPSSNAPGTPDAYSKKDRSKAVKTSVPHRVASRNSGAIQKPLGNPKFLSYQACCRFQRIFVRVWLLPAVEVFGDRNERIVFFQYGGIGHCQN